MTPASDTNELGRSHAAEAPTLVDLAESFSVGIGQMAADQYTPSLWRGAGFASKLNRPMRTQTPTRSTPSMAGSSYSLER